MDEIGNIEIKLNATAGRKIPYVLGKGNNRVDAIESDMKGKWVPEWGGWCKGMKITSKEGMFGAPRIELNLEIIGAP